MSSTISISPSLLSANFACLGEEVKALTQAGADTIHLDVMDGHFVPNITFGPSLIKALRSYTSLPFDVHLMITPVDPFIAAYVEAGADFLTVHPEAGPHLHRTLQYIRSHGKKAGVALNPGTSPDVLEYVGELVDMVLIMTVDPGFGGQQFLTSQCEKIRRVCEITEKFQHPITVAVDGGINPLTAPLACDAGANLLVAGTSIFKDGTTAYASHIQALRGACRREACR